jgi:[acyl-carrier-protein] S-malonyltransferase
MAAACALEPTGMAAVLGGEEAEILVALEKHGLYPANRNGAGQIVAAGAKDGLEKFAAEPPSRTRIIIISPAHPQRLLLSNADGVSVQDGSEMLGRLVRQVTAPVRWDLCMRTLADLGVTGVIELPPAGTLAGLVKRELKGEHAPEIVTLNTPDDLAAARDLIARHRAAHTNEPSLHFRVVVAAASGTFEPQQGLEEGSPIKAGQRIGQIVNRGSGTDVTAHQPGHLIEWLAHHDDPVAPGQPLARIGELS